MNKTKRMATALLIVMCMVVGMVALVACAPAKTVDIYFASNIAMTGATDENIVIDTLDEGAMLSDLIAANEQLDAVTEDSGYGPLITSIKGLIPDTAKGEYISVYTTQEEYKSEFGDPLTVVHDGKTFYSANVGISSLPVVDGESYLFVILAFVA